jgi:hypothetical protein
MAAAFDDQRLTGDSSVSAVIAELVRETDPAERRELRAALSHVDAELGTMPLRLVRRRHVAAMLDDLRDAGLSPRREDAVEDAVGSLFEFARSRGLVAAGPVAGPATRAVDPPPPAAVVAAPARPATATATMLALGARVATWTAVAIFIIFAALLIALVLELA